MSGHWWLYLLSYILRRQRSGSPKRTGGMAQGVGPEFKPQYCKKKKKFFL
jgi:hypothetical protein